MRLKHSGPKIEPGDPFRASSTGRKKAGEALTSIVDNIDLGGTIAITGGWGTGKTTFLKMWKQYLEDKNYPTVLLNAWETEWAEDPLIAVLACIRRACKQTESKEALDTVIRIANGFKQGPLQMIGAICRAALDNYVGDVSQSIDDQSGKAFEQAITSFDGKQKSLENLKESLEKLAWNVNQGCDEGKPLVFIIDELDRCKPDYAVRMLEVLKHFFVVQKIVFVCAVDKKHLEESIRGFYGSESINASEYLRRFFDLEINLPSPDYLLFCKHLYVYYQLDEYFESEKRLQFQEFKDNPEDFKWFLSSLAIKNNLSLRQLERIVAFTKLTLRNASPGLYYYPILSLFVTYLRFFDQPFYTALKEHQWTCQELLNSFQSKYLKMLDRKSDPNHPRSDHQALLFLLGKLLVSYNNCREAGTETLIDSDTSKTSLVPDKTLISKEDLDFAIKYATRGHDRYQLTWLFGILDLMKMDG